MLGKKKEITITEKVFKKGILSNIMNRTPAAIGGLVDGVIIGTFLGVDELAAYALVWPITLTYRIIDSIFGGGSRNIFTKLAGQGKQKEANNVFTLAFTLTAVLVFIAAGLTVLFADQVVNLLCAGGEHEHLRSLVFPYLMGRMIGIPFFSIGRIFSAYMSVDSDSKKLMYSALAMTATNVIGNFAVIFLFNGDIFLLGLATSISQIVNLLVLASHFLRKNRLVHFSLSGLPGTWEKIAEMVKNGLPAGFDRLLSSLSGILINFIIASFSASEYIAAFGVHRSMGVLLGAIYYGMSDAVWTLSSVYYGEEDAQALDRLQSASVRVGLFLSITAGLILGVFPHLFASLYINKDNMTALTLAIESVRVFSICIPFALLAYIFEYYLVGTGKTKASIVYMFFYDFAAPVLAVFCMVRLFGGRGAWIASPIYLTFMIFLTLFYICIWKNGLTLKDKRLLLDSNFGVYNGKEFGYTGNSMLDVVGMSGIALQFCCEQGVNKKEANKLSLCIEELGRNIVEHGFSDGEEHSFDLRMLVKDDGDVILRFRDDCKAFNLVEQYKLLRDDSEPMKNIGIRMVVRLCKDVRYIRTLGTNNLIIRI